MEKKQFDPTRRFADRVENYVKYRPGYPPELVDCLREAYGLTADSVIADVGSGTGLLTELFLKNGNSVYGVEPNDEMREAAEQLLADYPKFISVNGRSEATTLPDHRMDFVVAGQAFHWFEPGPTREEFGRILRPEGWVGLIWNTRLVRGIPFMVDYEALLDQYAIGYHDVNHSEQSGDLERFFPVPVKLHIFPNQQQFDLEGLIGRLLSSSYAPMPGHPNYRPMVDRLSQLFEQYQVNGQVSFPYETELYIGRI